MALAWRARQVGAMLAIVTPWRVATSERMDGQRAWTTASIVAVVCAAAGVDAEPVARTNAAAASHHDGISVQRIIT